MPITNIALSLKMLQNLQNTQIVRLRLQKVQTRTVLVDITKDVTAAKTEYTKLSQKKSNRLSLKLKKKI